MRVLRRLLPYLLVLLVLAVIWVLWNRPQQVNMASYVPADSLVYLEANSLPDIAGGIARTDAWRALAPAAGIRSGLGEVGWLSRIAAWTGIGPADAVVFSRAQVAATVLGVEASEEGEALGIRPRYAIVIETHTGARRTRSAIHKRVDNFARSAYGEPRVEEKEQDGVEWSTWSSATGERRIVLALLESVAIVGNDEATVRACVAVRRGERPSLADNLELQEMRRRLAGTEGLAFGYVSAQGAAKLFEVAAAYYVGQAAQDPQTQSLAANILPQMARKIFAHGGWSTRIANGAVEDVYYIPVRNDAAARLRDALTPTPASNLSTGELLPDGTYSVTRYATRDPLAAWRGLNLSISTQLDPVLSVMVSPFLTAALRPYGIEEPTEFLQLIGPEIVTARLDDKGESTVTIVQARDEKALREFVLQRLGTRSPQTERVGEAEILYTSDEERGAAVFVAGHLLMGRRESLHRCLEARREGRTLVSTKDFQQAAQMAAAVGPAHAVTYTKETAPARAFINFMAGQRGARSADPNEGAFERALQELPYTIRETLLIEGGIERKSRSAFGQLGVLAAMFSTEN